MTTAAPQQQELDEEVQVTPANLPQWEKLAAPPPSYDPPQLKPGFIPRIALPWTNWWQNRSTLAANACCPVACCVRRCFVPEAEIIRLDDPEQWMQRMLSYTHPNCPEEWKGIYWLCDNIAPHEFLVTLQDADWKEKDDQGCIKARKAYWQSWTTGTTAFGTGALVGAKLSKTYLKMQISPNGKWIRLGESGSGWIYRPGPEDSFSLPDGGSLNLEGDELMRLSTDKVVPVLQDENMTYQYRVRRVAYLDGGVLVKTKVWDEFLELAKRPLKYEPCCCGQCWCTSQSERALRNFPALPTENLIIFAPSQPKSS